MKTYVTTNVRLEASTHNKLKRIAHERGASLSSLFREMAARLLRQQTTKKEDPIWSLGTTPFDAGADAVTDISVNHDAYLYDDKSDIR